MDYHEKPAINHIENTEKCKVIVRLTLIILTLLSTLSIAEDTEKQKVNHSAIPPVISPDDPDMQKNAQDQIRILNAKKADYITKDMRVNGQPITRQEQKTKERIHREKFDKNPRQTIPLKQCIKPNGVIDNEVNECMNGRMKKTW